jgi:uncharacterized membrane protein YciS (DUF1049 family)
MNSCNLMTLLAVGFVLGFIVEAVAIARIWWRTAR